MYNQAHRTLKNSSRKTTIVKPIGLWFPNCGSRCLGTSQGIPQGGHEPLESPRWPSEVWGAARNPPPALQKACCSLHKGSTASCVGGDCHWHNCQSLWELHTAFELCRGIVGQRHLRTATLGAKSMKHWHLHVAYWVMKSLGKSWISHALST